MLKSTAALLAQPESGAPLSLEIFSEIGDHIIDGRLIAPDGTWYPVVDGLPKFPCDALTIDLTDFCAHYGLDVPAGSKGDDLGQAQTNVTFSDKWRRFRNYGLEPSHQVLLQNWFVKKFGLNSVDDLKAFYQDFETILEAGPGSGFNARFMAENSNAQVFTVDISEAAETAKENFAGYDRCQSVQADLFKTPFPDESFDFVIADGVLHHTPSTFEAVKALYRKVKPGGAYFFYVYKKMGAARYFVDRHIREEFKKNDAGRMLCGV
jgi:Methyltransferase domain